MTIMDTQADTIKFSTSAQLNYGEYAPTGALPIQGFAVHEGLYKKIVEIPRSELSNVANTLAGAQLRIDHSNSVRDIVGLVDESQVNYNSEINKDGVMYKAHVDDQEIADGVAKNKIKDVSIGFDLTPECSVCKEDFRECEHWFDEAHVIARDVKCFELSLVTRGADPDAHATAMGFTEQFENKVDFKDKENKDEQSYKGGEIMAEGDQSVDISGVVDKLSKAEKEALKATQKAEALTTELEALKAEKEQIEAEKTALADEKTQLEAEKAEIEGKYTDASTKLTEAEVEAKKEEATELAQLMVEKELIKEEEIETEVEKLMKSDDLTEVRILVDKFSKPQKEGSKVPKTEGFEKSVEKDKKIDYDDPEVEQKMIHELFAYDRVFKGKPEDKREGQSYMGFTLHE